MQVVWFNHEFNHDHEAGVFSWNTKIIKIQISIGPIEIVLHEDQFLPKWYIQKKNKKKEENNPDQ